MKPASRPAIFKGRQSDPELILRAVRGYLRSSLPFREVAARLCARGLQADHATFWRWVQRYGLRVVRQFEKLQRLYSPRSEEERVRRKAATKARSRLADREKQD